MQNGLLIFKEDDYSYVPFNTASVLHRTMFFSQDRNQLRQSYVDAWNKYVNKQDMTPLEQQIAAVIRQHPEYQPLINAIDRDYVPDHGQSNPFLHMGMHLALREQVTTNRPAGIQQCFTVLSQRLASQLEAEHQMMECLAYALWQAQQQSQAPDETQYLSCLQKMAGLEDTTR